MRHKLVLTENMRAINSPEFATIQDALRAGGATDDHVALLQQRVRSGIQHEDIVNALLDPECVVLADRNNVVDAVGHIRASALHCDTLSLHQAEVYQKKKGADGKRTRQMLSSGVKACFDAQTTKQTDDRPVWLQLAPGMQAIITDNSATSSTTASGVVLGAANGSDCIVVKTIRLPHNDTPLYTAGSVKMYATPPDAVIVRLTHPDRCNRQLVPGLPLGCVALFPSTVSIRFQSSGRNAEYIHQAQTVYMRQFSLVPRYAMTVFRCQGKTLSSIVIIIPDNTSFADIDIYVQLTRARSLESLYIVSSRPITKELLNCYVNGDIHKYITHYLLNADVNVNIAAHVAEIMDDASLATPVPLPQPPLQKK